MLKPELNEFQFLSKVYVFQQNRRKTQAIYVERLQEYFVYVVFNRCK